MRPCHIRTILEKPLLRVHLSIWHSHYYYLILGHKIWDRREIQTDTCPVLLSLLWSADGQRETGGGTDLESVPTHSTYALKRMVAITCQSQESLNTPLSSIHLFATAKRPTACLSIGNVKGEKFREERLIIIILPSIWKLPQISWYEIRGRMIIIN